MQLKLGPNIETRPEQSLSLSRSLALSHFKCLLGGNSRLWRPSDQAGSDGSQRLEQGQLAAK